jgi:hypothetical protein
MKYKILLVKSNGKWTNFQTPVSYGSTSQPISKPKILKLIKYSINQISKAINYNIRMKISYPNKKHIFLRIAFAQIKFYAQYGIEL